MGAVFPTRASAAVVRAVANAIRQRSLAAAIVLIAILAGSPIVSFAGIKTSIDSSVESSPLVIPVGGSVTPPLANPVRDGVIASPSSTADSASSATVRIAQNDRAARAGLTDTGPQSQEAQPLLIPLPSAMSTGICGLLAISVIGARRRLRRRLFA